MTPSLWLTGNPRIGKSTLLKETLPQYGGTVGGFYVTRHQNHHNILGYSMHALHHSGDIILLEEGVASPLFISLKENPSINFPLLESFALSLERELQQKKPDLLFFDEIGGVELRSEVFLRFLTQMIAAYPCIGVLKQLSTFQLDQREELGHRQQALKQSIAQQRGQILTVSDENQGEIRPMIEAFLKCKAPHPKKG